MTVSEFAERYDLFIPEQRENGFDGQNGGINVYSTGEFDVVLATLDRRERLKISRQLTRAGFHIREKSSFEREMLDGDSYISARFDPSNEQQARLSIWLAQVPTRSDARRLMVRLGASEEQLRGFDVEYGLDSPAPGDARQQRPFRSELVSAFRESARPDAPPPKAWWGPPVIGLLLGLWLFWSVNTTVGTIIIAFMLWTLLAGLARRARKKVP